MKYVSDFVIKSLKLKARIYNRLVWDSKNRGTYVRNTHGKLE
jgi:hypothetical protein